MVTHPGLNIEGLTDVQIDAQTCALVAWDTTRSADCLLDSLPLRKFNIPSGIVLRAFALELIFKAGIIAQSGKYPMKHNLVELFQELDQNTRDSITFEFNRRTVAQGGLEEFLSEQRNAFINWRYLHQQGELGCCPEYFRTAFICTHSALSARFPEIARVNPDWDVL